MKLTGSRYHLAQHCLYPFRPDVEVPEETQGDAAALGSEVHSYVELSLRKEDTDSLFYSPPATAIGQRAVGWLSDVAIPTAVEIAIAYHAERESARRIETKYHRDYGDTSPMEIPTTLDLVWVDDEHDEVVVRDLKTGKREHAHREQLVIQALAAARLYGKSKARVGFLFARKTKCEPDPLELLTADDLEAEGYRASALLRMIPTAKPQPGKWCWFCPARSVCPEHTGYRAAPEPKE